MHFYRMTENTYSKTSDDLSLQPDILDFELNYFLISLNCVNGFAKVFVQKGIYGCSVSSKAYCLPSNFF